jgi:5-formyltetrahydrofolate cyclo-ligase
VQPDDLSIPEAKNNLRQRLSAARRARGEEDRQAARTANSDHLFARLSTLGCIAAYLPLPTEPLAADLLDQLALRCRVLVPLVVGAAPLDWCAYPVESRRGALGIDEPVGPSLGPNAIAQADAVLVPALAVDPAGHRLGRGGGHYDRTLELQGRLSAADRSPAINRSAVRIAVLYDDELLESVPYDDLDQLVQATVTPSAGYRTIG